MSDAVDLAAVMGEVNIALDFQGIKWYGLYIIKAAYVFCTPRYGVSSQHKSRVIVAMMGTFSHLLSGFSFAVFPIE